MIGLSLGMQFGKGSGGGAPPVVPVFISTWKTDNAGVSTPTQVKLPLVNGGTYNFVVDWGDGNSDTITAWDQAESTHTYAIAGTYEIRITGTIVRWCFTNTTKDGLKLLNISAWGPLAFVADLGNFWGCQNLTCTATDTPDLSACTSLASCFRVCRLFNGAIGNWDISNVTDLNSMFYGCYVFNQDISGWNTSLVTNMSSVFRDCFVFNQPVGNWSTASLTGNLQLAFSACAAFNQDLSNWDVSNVTSIQGMFSGCTVFNGNVTNWDVSKVTNFISTFSSCLVFNQDISGWNTIAVTAMQFMFFGASAFNQNISGWNTALVTRMDSCFTNAIAFNQNLGTWVITALTNATDMFSGATTFTTANYDALLIGWEAQVEKPNVPFHAGTTKYSAGAAATARAALVASGWVITDGGQV